MREIWLSFGIIVICGVMLILSAVFNVGNQTAIAAEITPTSPAVQIAAMPTEELKNMDLDLSKAVTTESGLQYIDEVVGEGASPMEGEMVTVHYTGKLTNGDVFDSSVKRNEPFSFVIGVGQVIKGWDEGVITMKPGGKRTLIIPAELGYGSRGAGGVIPPNATLIFDVELLGIR
ncbi:FKBP-type peptidyl-prolyl cis-trans isomerase [Synechococcus moorigangaii CMS01]|nr:FKBP-type peptidyl-prolyl cis-trans isomerase [Synechococcus moorigangaii CMS01]